MTNASQLQPVLDRVDADFDNALERLFALLRIKSISADPAFAGDCRKAADHLAADIATLGFNTEVRPTAGHPAITVPVGLRANGMPTGAVLIGRPGQDSRLLALAYAFEQASRRRVAPPGPGRAGVAGSGPWGR